MDNIDTDIIPVEFIRSEKEEEKPWTSTQHGLIPEVPCIDLSNPDQENLVCSIADASKDWGIFQVVNHGIPHDLIAKLQAVGREFFQLPQEEKDVYSRPACAESIEGYGSKWNKNALGKKSSVDQLFHKILPPSSINYKFWPKNPASYRKVNEEYASHMKDVVDYLFRSLSLGLGLESHVLKEAVGGDELVYLMTINYYPPCPGQDLTYGLSAHTDFSTLTIMVPNEVPGLQVLKDDRWIKVRYVPNALIVNVGDQVQILSNGKYKSVMHRSTVDKNKTRMSWPIFLEPPEDMVIGPLEQLVDEDDPPRFKSQMFKEYVHSQMNKFLLR